MCLLPIYAASEDPIAGVTSEALANAIARQGGHPVHVIDGLAEAPAAIAAARTRR